MGFKSDVSDMLSDFAVLIKKPVTGYKREELLKMIMFLGTDTGRNLPDLFLGEDMKTIYFKFSNGVKEKIKADNLKTCMDYIAFLKHGIVEVAEKTRNVNSSWNVCVTGDRLILQEKNAAKSFLVVAVRQMKGRDCCFGYCFYMKCREYSSNTPFALPAVTALF